MSGPSDKAERAAQAALSGKDTPPSYASRALYAAHDPALGLDRSVCLRDAEREIVAKVVEGEYPVAYATIRADVIRDVVKALRGYRRPGHMSDYQHRGAADFIEREFGGSR